MNVCVFGPLYEFHFSVSVMAVSGRLNSSPRREGHDVVGHLPLVGVGPGVVVQLQQVCGVGVGPVHEVDAVRYACGPACAEAQGEVSVLGNGLPAVHNLHWVVAVGRCVARREVGSGGLGQHTVNPAHGHGPALHPGRALGRGGFTSALTSLRPNGDTLMFMGMSVAVSSSCR